MPYENPYIAINRNLERWEKLAEKLPKPETVEPWRHKVHARWFEEWLYSLTSIRIRWSDHGKQHCHEFSGYREMQESAPEIMGEARFKSLEQEILRFFEWDEFSQRRSSIFIELSEGSDGNIN